MRPLKIDFGRGQLFLIQVGAARPTFLKFMVGLKTLKQSGAQRPKNLKQPEDKYIAILLEHKKLFKLHWAEKIQTVRGQK